MPFLLPILSAVVLLGCLPNSEKQFLYVSYVIDGDTFVVDDRRIRIWGIDTPEKNEPYYQTARLTLEGLVEDVELECNFIETGKYRRDVMRCYADGVDIASVMVKKGMAKNVERSLGAYYEREEISAQKNKRGIWSDR